MIDQDLKTKIEKSTLLLDKARELMELSKYDDAESCAREVLDLLEPTTTDYREGITITPNSQLYDGIDLIAHAYNRILTVVVYQGRYADAITVAEKGIDYAARIGNHTRIVKIEANLGNVYLGLGDYPIALEYYHKAIASYEQLNDMQGVATNLLNIGNVYLRQAEYTTGLEYTQKALSLFTEQDDTYGRALCLANLGSMYGFFPDQLHLALEYCHQSLALFEQIGNTDGISRTLGNIGELYSMKIFSGYDPQKAEEFLLKALALIEEIGAKAQLYEAISFLVRLYEQEERWKDAYTYLARYNTIKDEVLNNQAKKQAQLLEQRKLIAERESTLALERAKSQLTEELLHKTLPKSIAERVIRGETHIADHFESVSVLFADVVGFTKISSSMSPETVLDCMNFLFAHFDAIALQHGCERIKTIGDGYMAVCGAPVPYDNHAERLAHMAFAMMEDITMPYDVRNYLSEGTVFHLRIGMHSGEITAGLIGTGKLAYDIYGDTVNTASRMESHGEAGKIHVTEEFKHAILDSIGNSTSIHFIPRSGIEIKGKGMMNTYFLERM